MRLGLIGRADRTGLGIETAEFVRHFPDTLVLVVEIPTNEAQNGSYYELNLENTPKHILSGLPLTEATLRAFLAQIDVLFTIETPYNPETYKIAREMGVKTVLRVNFEWLDDFSDNPDLFLAPSLWRFDEYPSPSEFLPYPIATDRVPFKLRKKAKTFVHLAGNMKAGYDRNGTEAFLKAIPLVKSQEARFIIRSQVPIDCFDPRVKVVVKDELNYWDNWKGEGDVLVLPRRYAGQSLPLNEAMASGLAIMASDMSPQNEFLPTDLLIPIETTKTVMIKKSVECAEILPEVIAKKIDEFAGRDISSYSKASGHIAKHWSWDALKPKYLKIFKQLYANANNANHN